MLDNFDYSQVPDRFAHCFKGTCKHADNCLRYLITSYIPEKQWSVPVINPAYIVSEDNCSGFMSAQPLRYAYGMNHLLDELPYRKANEVKSVMKQHYGKTY